jgi:hypothetical protein
MPRRALAGMMAEALASGMDHRALLAEYEAALSAFNAIAVEVASELRTGRLPPRELERREDAAYERLAAVRRAIWNG